MFRSKQRNKVMILRVLFEIDLKFRFMNNKIEIEFNRKNRLKSVF